MRARLKSGSFHVRFPKVRVYDKGDVIDDIEKVPECFRDRWEVLPPTGRRVVPAPVKKEEPKVEVKEEPAIKEELPKKKTTRKPRTTTKKTSSRRTTVKKK